MEKPFGDEAITVTKLDAARRQFRAAIELWFADGDPVAILTLAYAAYEIIHRLYKKQGLTDLLYDTRIVKDEYRNEFGKFLKEAPNFLKHANREDRDEKITFSTALPETFLVMSIVGLERMGEALDDTERAFNLWFCVHYPDAGFAKLLGNKGIPVDKARGALSILGKQEFLKAIIHKEDYLRSLL